MTDFEELRSGVVRARSEREKQSRNFFVAREKRRKLNREIASYLRQRDTTVDPQQDEVLLSLRRDATRLSGDVDRLRGDLDRARLDEDVTLAAFAPFTDPRQNIQRLADRHPILMLPVRLETRFKTSTDGDTPQLWVRVYPDDISVDTFEETPAEVEVRNVKAYWTHVWKAGGDDGEKRAAWRTLVTSHGGGRAHWLLETIPPENPGDEPERAEGGIVLVVATDQPLDPLERPDVATYWRDRWLAHGDATTAAAAAAALTTALGAARADVIRSDYVPVNFDDRPATAPTEVRVAFLDLPRDDEIETQLQPWGRPAQATVLPERFVLIGYRDGEEPLEVLGAPIPSTLVLGPDPSAEEDEQIRIEEGELIVPEPMSWMVDFDDALGKGMAFRVDLTPAQAEGGFDQLFVIGVRVGSDIGDSRQRLENLIRHHQASRKGFSIALQGTPTNNTEDDPSGYSWFEDPDVGYDHHFESATAEDPLDWRTKRDGRWLAEFLGIDPGLVRDSVNYFAQDQCDARAMNTALWPATLGYFMDRMMGSVFDDADIEAARDFFTQFVSGRGPIPAIRVGAQPYGILPATPFSRLRWMQPRTDVSTHLPAPTFVARLYERLLRVETDWEDLVDRVSFVGKPAVDPHQNLLDVLGLHPTSAEFYQRWAQSEAQIYNLYRYVFLGTTWSGGSFIENYGQSGLDLLGELGMSPQDEDIPEILSKYFTASANKLSGPIVDDSPLSEVDPVRAYREDGDNYLEWLVKAARDSHDTLRMQRDFLDGRPPTALLYLMLRHALDLGYVDTSILLHVNAGLMTPQVAKQARIDPSFVHVQAAEEDAGSQWQHLYKAEPAITSVADQLIGEYIPTILRIQDPYLNTQIEALEHLAGASTARLERAFVEHIDCCSYRYDAWRMGLVHLQLETMRGLTAEHSDRPTEPGSYLGAFGWLEDVRPENKQLTPVELPDDLIDTFERPGEPTLTEDNTNQGHILAPSLNHAVTAAVLRNGYLSNATPSEPEVLSVNLSSERVRTALGIIEGIRNGQSLAALLGYRLERGLHDREGLFLDDIILDLRRAFPLVALQIEDTQGVDDDEPIEALEARNVVDGLALLEHVSSNDNANYPFGLSTLPEITDATRRQAVDDAVDAILDVRDAVSDVAISESVHQVVQGNYDRAAGTFDAYSKGHFPPLPEVIQTPRSGITLVHRVGVQFEGDLDPVHASFSGPRAKGEPAIQRWLEGVLPAPGDIVTRVEFVDATTDAVTTPLITAGALGLSAVDLLYMSALDREQAATALDDTIFEHVAATMTPRADSEIKIHYTEAVAGQVTFFELAPLIRSLRAILLRSRPLRLTDVHLQGEAKQVDDVTSVVNPAKLEQVDLLLGAAATAADTFVTAISATLTGADDDAIIAQAVSDIDQRIGEFNAVAVALARFGFTQTDVASSLDWRRGRFVAVTAVLDELIARWEQKLVDFDLLLVEYDALDLATPDEDRIALLGPMERVLSTEPLTPPETTPVGFRAHVDGVVRPAFEAVLNDLRTIRSGALLSVMHSALFAAAAMIAVRDAVPFDLADERKEIRRYAEDLKSRAESTVEDIAARRTQSTDLLAAAAGGSTEQLAEANKQAARRLLDPDFAILSEFSLSGETATELQNAWLSRADLLSYAKNDLDKSEPVDEWLYGIARVREKIGHLESCIMLTNALNDSDVPLDPLQLPYSSQDIWLGLEYPETHPVSGEPFQIDGDRLLYTAHFGVPFDAAKPQCGVLLDEWTETIPLKEQTAGLTFHYDRPNSEPPQTMLLVTPAEFTGEWQWDDVVDALRETLEFAKKRAVEPAQIDDTRYARFLPAVVSSATRFPIIPMLNLAFNQGIQFQES